ncbi:MAG: tRNA pseudouridine(55) synthase TruB [Mucispirillum sp.]|nr:tRNA pseudouridine(55) synthase TruB [Mucispirillum sp.]
MNGVINIYKESGYTSFHIVDRVRKILNVSKCGHLGTLDPMAEGVLPVCVGYATRFADYLSSVNKEYIAEFRLGEKSNSYDSTGNIVRSESGIVPDAAQVAGVFSEMTGLTGLKVPPFSAKKINGVRAYKLARKGCIEDAGVRPMEIFSIDLLNYEYPLGIIKVSCGKGTYIRSIINEAGERLGTGALMSGLIRSANGIFKSGNSVKLDKLEEMALNGSAGEVIIPVTRLLDWGKAVVKDSAVKNIANGMPPARDAFLFFPVEHEGAYFFITDSADNLIAAAQRQENSEYPLKLKMVLK